MKPKGWYNESARHSLAAKGVKTGKKRWPTKSLRAKGDIVGRYNIEGVNSPDDVTDKLIDELVKDLGVGETDAAEDEHEQERRNLTEGLRAGFGDRIEINDFDLAGTISKKKTKVAAYLVIESDGSVRWYGNPDLRDDTLLRQVYVDVTGQR